MKSWVLNLRIRLKLLFAFGSILLLSVLLTVVGVRTILNIIDYNKLSERVDGLNISSLEMSSNIQEFIESGYKKESFLKDGHSELLISYFKQYGLLSHEMDTLEQHAFFKTAENRKLYDSLEYFLNRHNGHVKDLIAIYAERGFQDYGVEGNLRQAIHDVEDADFPYDRATMLMLRRHEKDFFLRKDLKYLTRFNSTISEFKLQIDTLTTDARAMKATVLDNIDEYQNQFNYIVKLEEKIGLSRDSGLTGALHVSYSAIEANLQALTAKIKDAKEQIVKNSMVLLLALLAGQLIVGLLLVLLYANMLTKSVKEIKSALVSLSRGIFPPALIIRTKDEMGEAKAALNNLVERIKAAVNFATDLGKGNLKITYDEKYNDDVLASAIINMKDRLVEAYDQQAAINWSNEGMARFTDILKNESESLEKMGDNIISQLVEYLKVNQGALYVLDKEKGELQRASTYAYHKKKYVDDKLKVGQGLVGQCVLERAPIHLTEVPSGYIKITSGLGEATANNLLLMPLMIREEVMGVIELASFSPFTKEVINFVKKVSENIANILVSKQNSEKTNRLLQQAQERAGQLSAQEEELRQNSEELQATQEEMQRQRKELDDRIMHLGAEIKAKEGAINRLKKEISLRDKKIEEVLS